MATTAQDNRGRRYGEIIRRFIRWMLGRAGPEKTLPEPPFLSSALGDAILLRGVSWSNDATFESLETSLPTVSIQCHRYSFKGPDIPEYEPVDTINDMRFLVGYMEQFVRGNLSSKPSYLLGHSLGGLVLANWICRSDAPADHRQLVDNISKVFLFATPLYPLYPWIKIPHPILGDVDFKLEFDFRPLLQLCPRIVVLWASKDPIAPREIASLSGRNPLVKPLDEVNIQSRHLDICNNRKAVDTVLNWIRGDFD